jgi:hypothetical protein
MEQLDHIQNIMPRWVALHETQASPEAPDEFPRSTLPDAPMQMLLRFTTESGPRTVIVPGVPQHVASAIALEMARAGHFAEYVDDRPRLAKPLFSRQRKNEKPAKGRALVKLAAVRS